MANYEKTRVKLTNAKLKKIKSTPKYKTVTTLRTTKKKFQDEQLPHELFLMTRQKTKIRDAFGKDMSANIKLSKTHLSKIIRSGWFVGALLSVLASQLMKAYAPWTIFFLALSAIMATASEIIDGANQRKNCEWGAEKQKRNYLCHFKWRYGSCYSNYKITWKYRRITWWSYWSKKTWRNLKNKKGDFLASC